MELLSHFYSHKLSLIRYIFQAINFNVVMVHIQIRQLYKKHMTRQQKLNELQKRKTAVVENFRTAISYCGTKKLEDFERRFADGTTTVKSIQDASEQVELAQKKLSETEAEIVKLRADTEQLNRDLVKVIKQRPKHIYVCSRIRKCTHTYTRALLCAASGRADRVFTSRIQVPWHARQQTRP